MNRQQGSSSPRATCATFTLSLSPNPQNQEYRCPASAALLHAVSLKRRWGSGLQRNVASLGRFGRARHWGLGSFFLEHSILLAPFPHRPVSICGRTRSASRRGLDSVVCGPARTGFGYRIGVLPSRGCSRRTHQAQFPASSKASLVVSVARPPSIQPRMTADARR